MIHGSQFAVHGLVNALPLRITDQIHRGAVERKKLEPSGDPPARANRERLTGNLYTREFEAKVTVTRKEVL
jgi:hypothetical protein